MGTSMPSRAAPRTSRGIEVGQLGVARANDDRANLALVLEAAALVKDAVERPEGAPAVGGVVDVLNGADEHLRGAAASVHLCSQGTDRGLNRDAGLGARVEIPHGCRLADIEVPRLTNSARLV